MKRKNIKDNVSNKVYGNVLSNVSNNVRDNVYSNVWSNVYNNVYNNVWSNEYNNISENVWKNATINVKNNVLINVWDNIWKNVSFNSHDASWLSFYDYWSTIPQLNHLIKPLDNLMELAHHCGWWMPYKEHVLLSHKHSELHLNKEGRLHNEHGMCIKYPDGYGFHALNGIVVEPWLVETKSEDLDPRKLLEIKNAEVRREFVRKVGIDRCWYKLAEVIHTRGTYELGLIDDRPYLKMLNPSIGVWHVEGVEPGCSTVEQALRFREDEAMQGIPRGEDGADWYQQGDLLIWPRGALKLKEFPSILT